MKKTGLFVSMLFAATSLFAGEVLTGDVAKAKFPAALQAMGLHDAKYMRLMDGVEYFYGRYDNLAKNSHDPNGFKNDMHLIRVDYANAPVRMKFWDSTTPTKTKRTTSAAASKCKALFGINGTFTNSSNTPQGFTKFQGAVIPNSNGCNSGLAMNDDKTFQYAQGWNETNAAGWSDVITSEAYGLHNGNIVYDGHGFSFANYPFSGVTADGILWIGVVDGRRSPISVGVSYWEIAEIQKALGCKEGMCHDGGGSTTMVISKELMTASDICDTQTTASDPGYYTMNYLDDKDKNGKGVERAVINQLLFVENVARVTTELSRHGQVIVNSEAHTDSFKVELGATIDYTIQADDGYQIAYLAYQGQPIDAAKGKTSYSGSFLADGDKTITATFVKKTAWWLKPKVVNDFAVAKYIKKNIYDGAAVAVDENNQNVYFGLSTHSYSSASNGVVGYAVADLVSGKSTPTCGTRAMYNDAGIALNTEYVKDIAVSATAKALLVGRKTGATNPYVIVCPLGKSWGDPEYANYNVSAKDARFLLQNDINFNDGDKTSVTQDSIFQCAFSPDGKRLYAAAGYSGNGSRYVLEYNVQADASGAMTGIQPTGKIFKFSTTVFSLACGKVNGKYLLIGTDTNGMLGMIAPDDFKADGNGFVSSTAQARYEKIGKFTGMCVTGAEDGTPRLIGSVANGQFSVYDIKPDCSGLVSTTPIVTYDHYATFDNTGMDAFACTSDDQTAFFSYTVIGDGNRKSLYAKVVQADLTPPPPGSEGNPWQIGGATESDSISVQTNGAGGLVIGGEGTPADGMMELPEGLDRNAIKHVTVGDGVTKLGSKFLKDFRRMTTLTCGSHVASFGDKALYRCLSLEKIEIGNANFDLSSLANAIVYQMAIKADGTLYMVPKVTVAGCTEMLYGKETLADADWTQIGPLKDQNLEELKKAGQYHFFQTRLVK